MKKGVTIFVLIEDSLEGIAAVGEFHLFFEYLRIFIIIDLKKKELKFRKRAIVN